MDEELGQNLLTQTFIEKSIANISEAFGVYTNKISDP